MNNKIAVFLVNDEVKGWHASLEDIDYLRGLLPDFQISVAGTIAEFKKLLPQVGVAITWKYRDEWVEEYPNVKIMGSPAAGEEFLPSAIKPGMHRIRGAFHGITMSETAIGMMLEHSRRIAEADARMQRGEPWPRAALDKSLRSFTGSHVAILGFGSIGTITAKRLKAFDCRITGVKRSKVPYPEFFTPGDSIVDFEGLMNILPTIDHLVSFLPDTIQTTDIINSKVFQELPNHAAVYNLGRGNSVAQDDLIAALNENEIAGAYLDVFKQEPLAVDSPLRNIENLFLMPHVSAISPDYLRLFFAELPAKLAELCI